MRRAASSIGCRHRAADPQPRNPRGVSPCRVGARRRNPALTPRGTESALLRRPDAVIGLSRRRHTAQSMLRELDPHVRMLDRALAGRYVLERRLGRGGTGVVFLARELRLDRPVAIKLLAPVKAGDPVARQRFLGEARTAAQLSHPNIVPIFSVDELADVVFFAMAYVEGQTLGQRIREHGPLSPEAGARLLREVARALAHAHERGVVARVGARCRGRAPGGRFAGGSPPPDAVQSAVATPVGPPLALRAFLVESRPLSVPTLLYGMILGLAIPLLALQVVTAVAPGPRLVAAGFIVWLLLLPTALMLARVRRLRAAGFDRDDLTDALAAELARHREGLAFLYGEGPSPVEGMLRTLTYAGLTVAGIAVTVGARVPHLAPVSVVLVAWGAGAVVALLAAITARARTERRTDLRQERRLRFWDGPLGRWLFRLSGRPAPRAAAPPPPAAGLPSYRTRTAPDSAPVRGG